MLYRHMLCWFTVLFILDLVAGNFLVKDLGRGKWLAQGKNFSSNLVLQLYDVVIPGCIHSDLLRSDPQKRKMERNYYYGFNDVEYHWIAESDWTYQTSFKIPQPFRDEKERWLVFEGLDTHATITLNGIELGKTDNMFVSYKFNVTDAVQSFNVLVIKFDSPVKIAENLSKNLTYLIPPSCPPDVQNGFCHINLLRKEQSSFSWDWGPGFATQGIWKPVYLLAFSEAVFHSFSASFDWKNKVLNVEVRARAPNEGGTGEVTADLGINIQELNITKQFLATIFRKFRNSTTDFIADVGLNLSNVDYELWWPNGMGKARLYQIDIQFNSSTSSVITCSSLRFGFRHVELVQDPITSFVDGARKGRSFYFRVNGKPMFAKGANWIPADAFHDKVTPQRIENLLESARLANMNMLRVWGGGVYESDELYQLADEKGIMLWQDFMFACSTYPSTNRFIESVEQEIVDNVWRLKHHASVVLWAGNNENEAALAKNWYNTSVKYDVYARDYKKLYIEAIGKLVEELDPTRPYLSSSPTNGEESLEEGGIAANPYDPRYGDVHYYNYDVDCLDSSHYPLARFVSEFGYQSWPSLESLASVWNLSDLTDNSRWVKHRQHHTDGNSQMNHQIDMHFQLPITKNQTYKFARNVFLGQMMQGLCYESQVDFYLRMQNETDDEGRGGTMGALYWQLNDIWQAPTWSSIEYDGNWKPLHYFARRFFSPLALITTVDDGHLRVHAHSSHDVTIRDDVIVAVHKWSRMGNDTVGRATVDIPSRSSKLVFERKLRDLLVAGDCVYQEQCFFSTRLATNDIPVKFYYPTKHKFKIITGVKDPNLQIVDVHKRDDKSFVLQLQTDYPALFVWLKSVNLTGRFSDNAFMMTTPTRHVTFHPWRDDADVTADAVRESVTVESLYTWVGAAHEATWLDNITAKLTFAIVGVIFVVVSAVQVTCLVMRLNKPTARRGGSQMPPNSSRSSSSEQPCNDQLLRSRIGSSASTTYSVVSVEAGRVEIEEETAAAFLIRSKHGYGHDAKHTEFRFYIV